MHRRDSWGEGSGAESAGLGQLRCVAWKRGRPEASELVLRRWPHSREAGGNLLQDNKSQRPVHRHVMNELLDTERVYVEELLCVLEVSLPLGGRAGGGHGPGFPTLGGLLPTTKQVEGGSWQLSSWEPQSESNSDLCPRDEGPAGLGGCARGPYSQREKELLLHRTSHDPRSPMTSGGNQTSVRAIPVEESRRVSVDVPVQAAGWGCCLGRAEGLLSARMSAS